MDSSIPCTDTSELETYLNSPEVREALHVPEFVRIWEPCRLVYRMQGKRRQQQLVALMAAAAELSSMWLLLQLDDDVGVGDRSSGAWTMT